jgi:hypothetical protein
MAAGKERSGGGIMNRLAVVPFVGHLALDWTGEREENDVAMTHT